jgi:hypothetical protein
MLKIFRPPAGAEKKKNEAAFYIFFGMANLYEIFYVMKVVGNTAEVFS